jgi:hypothetical protein
MNRLTRDSPCAEQNQPLGVKPGQYQAAGRCYRARREGLQGRGCGRGCSPRRCDRCGIRHQANNDDGEGLVLKLDGIAGASVREASNPRYKGGEPAWIDHEIGDQGGRKQHVEPFSHGHGLCPIREV